MNQFLDFNDGLFGNISEYKQIIVNLLESLKSMTPETFWNTQIEGKKGLSAILYMEIIELITDSYRSIADHLYANKMVAYEFPYFIEVKGMVESLLSEDLSLDDSYINLAINLSADFFTLLEVKLLLFGDYDSILTVPDEVMDEYEKELEKYIEQFEKFRDEFIKIYDKKEYYNFDTFENEFDNEWKNEKNIPSPPKKVPLTNIIHILTFFW